MKNKKLFIATPIAGFENEEEYKVYRDVIANIIEAIRESGKVENIYSIITEIKSKSEYDSPAESAYNDLMALENASHFIFFYPQKVLTSAFVELGYAVAKRKEILIIANNRKELPYIVQGFDKISKYNTIIIEPNKQMDLINEVLEFLD